MESSLYDNFVGIAIRYRSPFIAAFLFAAAGNLLQVSNPLLLREAVNALAAHPPAESSPLRELFEALFGRAGRTVFPWAGMLILISLISNALKYMMRVNFFAIAREEERLLRERLFEKLQGQSRKFYDDHTTGELLSLLTNDISLYREVIGPGILFPAFSLSLIIPSLIALFYISPPLALFSLSPLILIPLCNRLVRKRLYALSRSLQEKLAELSSTAQEHYSGIRIIKGYAKEKMQRALFTKGAAELAKCSFHTSCLQGLLFPLFALITRSTTVLLVLAFATLLYRGWAMLDTADFVSFMWVQSFLYFPILMLGWVLPIYERGKGAYDRLYAIYSEPVDVREPLKAEADSLPPSASIELKNLTFSYPGCGEPALKAIDLVIPGGSFVGITGPVGAGKSTLLKLIDREYDLPKGMLFIGGREIHDYPLSAFQRQISTVEQMPFLFSRSIAENVKFGRQEASEAEIVEASEYADLHRTVMEFSDRYNTVVGERGLTLSGGQKQRVAIARALLVGREILLFDDIFSSVDAATERKIFDAIARTHRGKTILLVAQRASILSRLDLLLFMKGGKIVEQGTPQELAAKRGEYFTLMELQKMGASI